MSLEEALKANTAALEANTAALKGAAAGKPAAASTDKPKADSKPKSEHTRAEMQTALNEVKEKFSPADAKAIISETGGVVKLADIPDAKIDAVYEAAKKKLAAEAGGDDDI